MTITLFAAGKAWPRIYRGVPQTEEEQKNFHYSIWKRIYEDAILLTPGVYEIAIMSHHYGIPDASTIIPIVSQKEHEGADVGGVKFAEGSTGNPLLGSHNIESRFG